MKRLALWLLVAAAAPALLAQNPDAEFLRIYNLIQEAQDLEARQQYGPALERFQQAHRELESFARAHPTWNRKLINFRLGYVGARLGVLKEHVPAPEPLPEPAPEPASTVQSPFSGRSTQAPLRPGQGESGEVAHWRQRAQSAEQRAAQAEGALSAATLRADKATARANELEDRNARLALDLRQALDRLEVLTTANQNLERAHERLLAEGATLRAKLNEALSPRPAAIDPAELEKARERQRLLVMENEILKASLEREMEQNRKLLAAARGDVAFEQQLQAARAELSSVQKEAADLREESRRLREQLELAARRHDAELRAREEETAALRAEIASLQRDLAALRAPAADRPREAPQAAPQNVELASIRADLERERARREDLERENHALVRELERLSSIRVTPASLRISEVPVEDIAAAEAARAWRLERERDELRRQLQRAREELRRTRPAQDSAGKLDKLAARARQLESRLALYESEPEPYAPEELALFKPPARATPLRAAFQVAQADRDGAPEAPVSNPRESSASASGATNTTPAATATNSTPANPSDTAGPASGGSSRRRTARDLPPGAGSLAAQAQRAFSMRRLDEAEQAYRDILKLDPDNVFTLGNLGAILVEQGRLPDAEQTVKRALQIDPDDPFSLSLLGIIHFRQQRFDEAYEALSRSAQIDPDNADTQNYLGITLSQRGQRQAAEAALRKALRLNPNSPTAHYNLAVVYATQNPPFTELARFHYQKARRAGQPANPAFEQLLNRAEAEPSSPASSP